METYRKKIKRKILTRFLCVFLFASMMTVTTAQLTKPAEAAICCRRCCTCLTSVLPVDLAAWTVTYLDINVYIAAQLFISRNIFMDVTFWQQNLLPGLMQSGVTFAAIGSYQVSIVGMFMDAQEQMQAQRLMQRMHARTHKDYQPSEGMCEFGTRVTTLASSERQAEVNARVMSQRTIGRFLGATGSTPQSSVSSDVVKRLNKIRTEFCDVRDNDSALEGLCPQLVNANFTAQEKAKLNADMDYQRSIADPLTIPVNLLPGGTLSEEEETIFAVSDNLYGFNSFEIADFESLQNDPNQDLNSLQQAYLDMRSTVAKTKVAENSFNAIVGMKSEGTTNASRTFMVAYLEELGMPAADIDQFLGDNPSYYAQMEILTKKAYQSPLFYTNLYDKPTNVERKGVAMQAIGLIQKFDLLKSYMRTEASLSILLELAVLQLQREVEDNILGFKPDQAATQE